MPKKKDEVKVVKAPAVVDLKKVTKAEARVIIAKDVLSQLKAKKLTASRGTYLRFYPKKQGRAFSSEDTGADLQSLLKKRIASCEVCAKGGLFISMVRKFDKVKVPKVADPFYDDSPEDTMREGSYVTDALKKYFSSKQLDLIECAFENGEMHTESIPWETRNRISEFLDKYRDEEDDQYAVLKAIMKNIIKNNGTFVV